MGKDEVDKPFYIVWRRWEKKLRFHLNFIWFKIAKRKRLFIAGQREEKRLLNQSLNGFYPRVERRKTELLCNGSGHCFFILPNSREKKVLENFMDNHTCFSAAGQNIGQNFLAFGFFGFCKRSKGRKKGRDEGGAINFR